MATYRVIIRPEETQNQRQLELVTSANTVAAAKGKSEVTTELTSTKTAYPDEGVVLKVYEYQGDYGHDGLYYDEDKGYLWTLEDTTYHKFSSIKFYTAVTDTDDNTILNGTPLGAKFHAGDIATTFAKAAAPNNNLYVWTNGIEDADVSWTIVEEGTNVFVSTTGNLVTLTLSDGSTIKAQKLQVQVAGAGLTAGQDEDFTNSLAVNATEHGGYNYAAVAATTLTVTVGATA